MTLPEEFSSHGCGTFAKNYGGSWNCLAAQGGRNNRRRSRDPEWKSRYGAEHESRSGSGSDFSGWPTAEARRAAPVFHAEQAERLRDYGQRSRGPSDGDGI